MSEHGGASGRLDPALRDLVERLVDERVAARLDGLTTKVEEALGRLGGLERAVVPEQASILVFSGDLDRLMSAFIIANGAVAMGLEVSMYFTFWGLVALKKRTSYAGKTVEAKLLAAMLPGGPSEVGTSKMHMLGMGPIMFKRMMAQQNVETLPGLIAVARELGVKLIACQMARGVMGIREDELIAGVEFGGVATYLGDAIQSKVTLFI